MKQRTKEEVTEFVEKLWGDDLEKLEVSVFPDSVELTLSNMYSAPGLNFAKLKAISEFFETENINDDDTFSYGGCETCDYGSSYGFTLTIRPNGE